MKYRVDLDISFDNEDDGIALINFIEKLKTKAFYSELVDTADVPRRAKYHECHHDEDPVLPCTKTIIVAFDKVEEQHKNTAGKIITYTSVDTTIKEKIV